MPKLALTEEPMQFGEGGRLFGMLTQPNLTPGNTRKLPVFIFLNAGLLHRVGPSRLHVRLARELAAMGFSSLRVDLAGTGDSPRCVGLTPQQSVAADFEEIMGVLDLHLGDVAFVLFGLCSGADNAIRLTLGERRVVGLVLFDPVCFPNDGFLVKARTSLLRRRNLNRYILALKNRLNVLTGEVWKTRYPLVLRNIPTQEQPRATVLTVLEKAWKTFDPLKLRDIPTQEQLRAAFLAIREREGQVLSVFTNYAFHRYYNRAGQLGRVVKVEGYNQFCTELFWPEAIHTYPLEVHRRRVIEEVKTWASDYVCTEHTAA